MAWQPWEPGEQLIDQLSVPGHHMLCTREEHWLGGHHTFHNSINERSFLLWEVLRKNHQDLDWLALPVSQLMANKNFGEISLIMNNLSVVNDPAERMIRLLTKRGAGQHGDHGVDQPRDLGSGQHRGLGPTQHGDLGDGQHRGLEEGWNKQTTG